MRIVFVSALLSVAVSLGIDNLTPPKADSGLGGHQIGIDSQAKAGEGARSDANVHGRGLMRQESASIAAYASQWGAEMIEVDPDAEDTAVALPLDAYLKKSTLDAPIDRRSHIDDGSNMEDEGDIESSNSSRPPPLTLDFGNGSMRFKMVTPPEAPEDVPDVPTFVHVFAGLLSLAVLLEAFGWRSVVQDFFKDRTRGSTSGATASLAADDDTASLGAAAPDAPAAGEAPAIERLQRMRLESDEETEPRAAGSDAAGTTSTQGHIVPKTFPPMVHPDLAVALGALLAICFATIALTRVVSCHLLANECDMYYTLGLFLRQDLQPITADLAILFLVGHVGFYPQLPVTSPWFVATVFASSVLFSQVNMMPFTKVSVSYYEMMCKWSALTWGCFVCVFMLLSALLVSHGYWFIFRMAASERLRAAAELCVAVVIFVMPLCTAEGFHLHHWYYTWLLALFCRVPTRWSKIAQAICIGGYVNGVACYGRDPVLGCQAAWDSAYSLQCPWLMKCFYLTATTPAFAPANHAPTYQPPNAQTCARGDYV